mgnify:CR=1 FL=1
MKNELSRAMASADVKVRYDTQCKRVLSQKEILARILARTVKEFAGMSVEEIIPCIEGTPEIAVVSIDPGKTNQKRVLHMEEEKRIAGLANEDKVADEGEIYYDIRFYVHIPNEEGHIRMIVNLEAQKSYYPGYEIVTRGIFYDARMISAQLGTEFEHSKYDDMKKVYSIWVCMNPPKERRNTVTQYSIQEKHVIGEAVEQIRNYDLMSAVMICLGDEDDKNYGGLLKFLEVLLSEEKSPETKKEILETEFDVPMTQTLESEVRRMCNLSQGVKERAMEQGVAKGIGIGEDKATLNAIRNVMDSFKVSVDAAMDALHIPEADRAKYRAMLQS